MPSVNFSFLYRLMKVAMDNRLIAKLKVGVPVLKCVMALIFGILVRRDNVYRDCFAPISLPTSRYLLSAPSF